MNTQLLKANVDILHGGTLFLESIGNGDYVRIEPRVFNTTIGRQVRHIVDHYSSLLRGIENGTADYQRRRRDPIVETSRLCGIQSLQQVAQELKKLGSATLPIQVSVENREEGLRTVPSSLERELDMLLSHTIHHYALIAVVASLCGWSVPVEFGVAPATLRQHALDLVATGSELF